MIDYTKPTPETDAFMAKIDGDEIDLDIVRAKLHDMERERDSATEDLIGLLGKTVSIYSVLHPKQDMRMPYVLINGVDTKILSKICSRLNRLRRKALK